MYLKQVNANNTVNPSGESMTAEDKQRDDDLRNHKSLREPFEDIPWKDSVGASRLYQFAQALGQDAFIAGGSVASCIYGSLEDCGDVDVWFNSLLAMKTAMISLEKMGYYYDNGITDFETVHNNPSTINYVNMAPVSSRVPIDKKIQLVKRRWYPNCLEVINHFDLLHCKIGFQVGTSIFAPSFVVSTPNAIKSCQDKIIYISGTMYPGHLMSRLKKYRAKGFKFPDKSDWPEFDDKPHVPTAADYAVMGLPTPNSLWAFQDPGALARSVGTPAAAPQNKFDNPEYWNDYNNLGPEEFNRKWK